MHSGIALNGKWVLCHAFAFKKVLTGALWDEHVCEIDDLVIKSDKRMCIHSYVRHWR